MKISVQIQPLRKVRTFVIAGIATIIVVLRPIKTDFGEINEQQTFPHKFMPRLQQHGVINRRNVVTVKILKPKNVRVNEFVHGNVKISKSFAPLGKVALNESQLIELSGHIKKSVPVYFAVLKFFQAVQIREVENF